MDSSTNVITPEDADVDTGALNMLSLACSHEEEKNDGTGKRKASGEEGPQKNARVSPPGSPTKTDAMDSTAEGPLENETAEAAEGPRDNEAATTGDTEDATAECSTDRAVRVGTTNDNTTTVGTADDTGGEAEASQASMREVAARRSNLSEGRRGSVLRRSPTTIQGRVTEHPSLSQDNSDDGVEEPPHGTTFGPLGPIVPCLHEFLHPGEEIEVDSSEDEGMEEIGKYWQVREDDRKRRHDKHVRKQDVELSQQWSQPTRSPLKFEKDTSYRTEETFRAFLRKLDLHWLQPEDGKLYGHQQGQGDQEDDQCGKPTSTPRFPHSGL